MKRSITRRSFLATSSLALGAPTIIPGSALGKNGAVAPSNRIVVGGIGLGRRGRGVGKWLMGTRGTHMVAIADVWKKRGEIIRTDVNEHYGNSDCVLYRDFREIMNRDDIDAVAVATGDRWHAPISILAMRAGKDVYSEKPCALTIDENRELAEEARKTGRIYQGGTQRRASLIFRFAAYLAQERMLGKIHTVHASITPLMASNEHLPAEAEPPVEEFDWDLWLGPTPRRPYNKRYRTGWHGFSDFAASARLLDFGSHTIDICQLALGKDGTTPVEFEADKDGLTVNATYKDGTKMVMSAWKTKGRWTSDVGQGPCPVKLEGDEGWVEVSDSGIHAEPVSLLKEYNPFIKRERAKETEWDNMGNFVQCIQTRATPICNADVVRSSHVAGHAAGISWLVGRKLKFDPVKEKFVGDDEANSLRTRIRRKPWHLNGL
jgi:predicted dehydrogenase